jgi:hypothetical protein
MPNYATQTDIDNNYRYISGVPSPKVGAVMTYDYVIQNAVKTHYTESLISTVLPAWAQEPPEGLTIDINNVVTSPPASLASLHLVVPYAIQGATYVDTSASTRITGYNSAHLPGTYDAIKSLHIDAMLDETDRYYAGSGAFTIADFGQHWLNNSVPQYADLNKKSLADAQMLYELQLNGQYIQYPLANYSTLDGMPVGPDYSSLPSNDRYYLMKFPLTSAHGIYLGLEFEGNVTGTNGWQTDGILLQGIIYDETGVTSGDDPITTGAGKLTPWMDFNAPHDGRRLMQSTWDPIGVCIGGTHTQRQITFCSGIYTGTLYLRIGIKSSARSNIKFKKTGITVTQY